MYTESNLLKLEKLISEIELPFIKNIKLSKLYDIVDDLKSSNSILHYFPYRTNADEEYKTNPKPKNK
jgi:hypothetical protein